MIKDGSLSGPAYPRERFDLSAVMEATSILGVSHQIRERRLALGWSQEWLSDKSGISQHTICRLELGKCEPNYRTIKRIVEALGLFVSLEAVSAEVLLVRAESYRKGVI